MAEQWTQKFHDVRDEEGKLVKGDDGKNLQEPIDYRIDAEFVPDEISKICIEFIANYCKANKQRKWFEETVNKPYIITKSVKNKETGKKEKVKKSVPYPFVNIRSDFTKKFFPEIIKGEPEKKPTIKERYGDDFWND